MIYAHNYDLTHKISIDILYSIEPTVSVSHELTLTCGTSSTKDESADWHSLGVLPLGVDDGALGCRAGEAGVGMGSIAWHSYLPGLSQPVSDCNVLEEEITNSCLYLQLSSQLVKEICVDLQIVKWHNALCKQGKFPNKICEEVILE